MTDTGVAGIDFSVLTEQFPRLPLTDPSHPFNYAWTQNSAAGRS